MSGRPLPSSFDGDEEFFEESRLAKLKRRIIEEPLIPLGCALTAIALYRASRAIKTGDKSATNKYFRARIYAQGFTVAAMIAGSYYWQSDREKRKHMSEAAKEKRAEEKRTAWIKELEARDEEDKAIRERAKQLAEKRKVAAASPKTPVAAVAADGVD
ncbi:hypoxia induced protein conserved region-domain-containing protein [Kalaharituber pfeilii]|nr:hypoxia induced protein conserved region-domain-containing protein [Kalaharituber pfeilii]